MRFVAELQNTNKYNRVGVVLYSGNTAESNSDQSHATVLLEFGRYTHSQNTYLVTNKDENVVWINQNVYREGQTNAIAQNGKNVQGGTYIQNGIYQSMQQLWAADTVIEGDGIQAGTVRMPIMVLMSDGAPTAATEYILTVQVADDGEGALVAETSITNEAGAEVAGISFTNTYTAEATTVVLTGDKVLTNKTLQAGEFSFALYSVGETFKISGDALQTVTNDAGGRIVFDALTLDRAGGGWQFGCKHHRQRRGCG